MKSFEAPSSKAQSRATPSAYRTEGRHRAEPPPPREGPFAMRWRPLTEGSSQGPRATPRLREQAATSRERPQRSHIQQVSPPRCLLDSLSFFHFFFAASPSALSLDATAGQTLMFETMNVCLCVLRDMREEQQHKPLQQCPRPSRPAFGSGGCGEPLDTRSEQGEPVNGEHPAATPEKREHVRQPSSSSCHGNRQPAPVEAEELRSGPEAFRANPA